MNHPAHPYSLPIRDRLLGQQPLGRAAQVGIVKLRPLYWPGTQNHIMETELLKILKKRDYVPLNIRELLHELHLPKSDQIRLQQVLRRLERSGKIARIKQGERYALPSEADLIP